MKKKAWQEFVKIREKYRFMVQKMLQDLPKLGMLEQKLIDSRSGPAYKIETAVVYNGALDDITQTDTIKLILVADNPGRREQAAENRRYLVGPSGKIAEGFFRNHPELEIDFRKNAIILNKTPVHTPRTAELAELCSLGGAKLSEAINESQKIMAELLLEFHRALAPIPVWIIGYSEMKKGGVFETYTEDLIDHYAKLPKRREEIFFFRHFSMNQFTIDFNKQALPKETAMETLKRMGSAYRERVMGTKGN
ncbi:hypothetical protein [Leadbettera azotonutricia]|uniref:Uracil-DNA glycosylase-like domain-containing protein n=1 Tax=Leadbettera azotonutricia (strain ATCC BAA-888 / DSM 13862 / ZAS-9) TaxID=545695 RepID=F5YA23_LEAAZ|nr:hypothetical protein [Leadbettera azotonutricia]AEF80828.1 conserved hypothetical protein [Leadbettera azotonutricia ZAS-9]